jgi:CDP-glucose 4,6-dehydratase
MYDMKAVLASLSGCKVLVTGHTGFKGTWLSLILKEAGAEVLGYSLPPTTEFSHFELIDLERMVVNVKGDIRDAVKVNHVFKNFKPDVVFHLAAQALVKESYINPLETFHINTLGSINLLDAVRDCESVRALVYVTSDKCYENFEWIWGYRETDPLGGRDAYSASKAAAEIAFSSYQRSFFSARASLGAASARAGNVIGGGDWAPDRIIPDCVRSIVANTPIKLRRPFATRPWQHVLEPLGGYLLLASRLLDEPKKWEGAWNFGPSTDQARSVESVTKSFLQNIRGNQQIELDCSKDRHHEAQLLQLNCDRAKLLLDWSPRWGVDDTIQKTAEWYRCWMEGRSMQEVTRSQIREFFKEIT